MVRLSKEGKAHRNSQNENRYTSRQELLNNNITQISAIALPPSTTPIIMGGAAYIKHTHTIT